MTDCDVLVLGSGSGALAAALRAARGGLSVIVAEKTEKLGGTSAMSGAGTWVPANAIARAAGVEDSEAEALAYIRAVSPEGWGETEDELWQAFVATAPKMLDFLGEATPLSFALVDEPDPISEGTGGKSFGRMLSPGALSRRILGVHAKALRRSTLPHLFTYQEVVATDPYHHPLRAGLRLWPKLLWRWLTDAGGQGTALMTGLLKGCLDAGCHVQTGLRAVALSQDATGGVTGAEFERADGTRLTIAARRGVVIATGGFEWDEAMRRKHFPGPLDRLGSPRTNTGDGQKLAEAAGARLDRMDQANIHPCLPTRYEGQPHGLPMVFQAEPHSIVVDRHGRRFVSESDFNIGEAMDRRDPATGEPLHLPVWLIADRRFLKRSAPFRWYAAYEKDWIVEAPTLRELAARIGLPAEALAETVARFNGFCDAGRDADFRRGESAWESYKSHGPEGKLGRIEEGPFLALSMNRSILGTKGGARTNAKGQVLRPDGSVISGLYAAGLAMANPFGTRSIGAGTTIGPNMTWGYICAETMLRENRGAG
ncbi:dehydrogenase [Aureimonas endophytica]|uniref:Dehydrogenase n=1 Tax=Aureimonas endophytica TaxID=2027858 RepID=A0A916ZP60_9HYPH|nr:FAD-binding protein [Aureimonas endophytica]GGE05855.1 dehydrogenase [Aureimonas endophytica]